VIRLPILPLLAAVALAAAACGGGGSDEPEGVPSAQWAASVCGSLQDWQTSLQQKAQALTRDVMQANSPEASKRQIGDFLDEVIVETDAMMAEIGDAEQPAVDQGEQIAADFRTGLERMKEAFEAARENVAQVPTNDPEAFQQELTRIGTQLQSQGEAIGKTFAEIDETYDVEELSRAFEENEDCEAFTG
jgi:hypothetical protein